MIGFFPQPEPWMLDAACARVDNELFYPDRGQPTKDAKLICRGCPSRDACLEYALQHNERWGVWGATSERERAKMRREQQGDAA
jgi:WhiB family redox-sensing transcriptional regulator